MAWITRASVRKFVPQKFRCLYIAPANLGHVVDLIQLGVDGTIVAGVIPHSSPNVGAYNTESIALQGTLKITSEYPGSVTDFFSFQQFYFGCVAGTLEAIASAPIACTITVTGYRESVQVARQKFSYNPGTVVTAPMKKVKLSKKFEYIDEVTFTTEYSVPDAGATLLDDLKYDAFSMKNGESQEEWSGKSE